MTRAAAKNWFMVTCLLLGPCAAAACAGPDPTYRDGGAGDYGLVPDMLSCLPNSDGVIQQDELVFRATPPISYRTNPPGTLATLNPAGELIDGKLQWDFSSLAGQVVKLRVEGVTGTWFAKHFPTGEITMPTSVADDTLQVLKVETGRVLLLGLASRKQDHTLTIYDPPVVAMRFPLQRGLSFSSSASLKEGSKIAGLPVTTVDTFEVAIRTEGVLRLPNLKLHRTLLIETRVTSKTLGGVVNSTRQLQWFSECYGEVARALSQLGESKSLFEKATELRRLTF